MTNFIRNIWRLIEKNTDRLLAPYFDKYCFDLEEKHKLSQNEKNMFFRTLLNIGLF